MVAGMKFTVLDVNNVFHSFSLPLGPGLFNEMKNRVLQICRRPDQSMLWHDGFSLCSLNSPDDLDAAVDYAMIIAKTSDRVPEVHIKLASSLNSSPMFFEQLLRGNAASTDSERNPTDTALMTNFMEVWRDLKQQEKALDERQQNPVDGRNRTVNAMDIKVAKRETVFEVKEDRPDATEEMKRVVRKVIKEEIGAVNKEMREQMMEIKEEMRAIKEMIVSLNRPEDKEHRNKQEFPTDVTERTQYTILPSFLDKNESPKTFFDAPVVYVGGLDKGKKARWSVWWGEGHADNTSGRATGNQSLHRALLTAAIHAIDTARLRGMTLLIIRSYSTWLISDVVANLAIWKSRDWKKMGSKKTLMDNDLLMILDSHLAEFPVRFEFDRSLNEKALALANDALENDSVPASERLDQMMNKTLGYEPLEQPAPPLIPSNETLNSEQDIVSDEEKEAALFSKLMADIAAKVKDAKAREDKERAEKENEEMEKVIALVMSQSGASKDAATEALKKSDGDAMDAIMSLIHPMPPLTLVLKTDRDDIGLVMEQAQVSREEAMTALLCHGGDVIGAIMSLTE